MDCPDGYYVVDSDTVKDRLVRVVGDTVHYVTSTGLHETFPVKTCRNFRSVDPNTLAELITACRTILAALETDNLYPPVIRMLRNMLTKYTSVVGV